MSFGKEPMSTPKQPVARVRIRRAQVEDVPKIFQAQKKAYAHLGPWGICTERQLRMQIEAFPEGQFVAVRGERIYGYAASMIITLDENVPSYSYAEITGNGSFSTHDPSGDTLYGAEMFVVPKMRGRGIAGKLYDARKKVMRRLNLRRMVAGGRIPGYLEHSGRWTPEEYVKKVRLGELKDPALNAHLRAGYEVKGIHLGYLRDEQSLNYATYLEMQNEDYDPARRRIAAAPIQRPVRHVRVMAGQYQLRRISSWEQLEEQVEFFVAAAADYHCHFLLLPELFTVQMFSAMPRELEGTEAVAQLAEYEDRYKALFSRLAKDEGLHIVAGSTPVRRGDEILNTAFLFTPQGEYFEQEKLQVTPNEREEYGIAPGKGLRVFDTGLARIAIVICYDVEFPEMTRLMVEAGAEILFVPFSTDERKAYLRVRHSAHARAVENQIYVVLAGNVGNLPGVENFLINYGQAAVLTPCDFNFPSEGIAALADTSGETVVISDLDLGALELARDMGSVRPLRDLRRDLFRVEASEPVEVIQVGSDDRDSDL